MAFKHEGKGYAPFKPDESGTELRPWWMCDDELLIEDENKYLTLKKINELSRDEFMRYQKEGRIPESYDVKDWVTK